MVEQCDLFDLGRPPAVLDRGAVLSPCGRYRYRLWMAERFRRQSERDAEKTRLILRRWRSIGEHWRRFAWQRSLLASIDEAHARRHVEGAAVRAWLAATVGERLPLP